MMTDDGHRYLFFFFFFFFFCDSTATCLVHAEEPRTEHGQAMLRCGGRVLGSAGKPTPVGGGLSALAVSLAGVLLWTLRGSGHPVRRNGARCGHKSLCAAAPWPMGLRKKNQDASADARWWRGRTGPPPSVGEA
ncbi:hypothetical protein SEVIR_3G143401v4 [Setaria viridis]|uniref:Uncharacterized protein n=1 Tax=Setaria viridis TaxID=4556 RepID=A0A4U6V997_SETVI|nr:hypothetical protein SEVIR_3G143401v2 [Setaria viridis]